MNASLVCTSPDEAAMNAFEVELWLALINLALTPAHVSTAGFILPQWREPSAVADVFPRRGMKVVEVSHEQTMRERGGGVNGEFCQYR
jgi:hypothetical protein